MRSERSPSLRRTGAPGGPTATRTSLGGVRVVIPGLLLESEANERGHARAKARRTAAQRSAVGSTLRVLSLVADGIEDAARSYQRDRVAAASAAELLALAKLRDVDLAAITPKLPTATATTPETP